MAGEHGHDSDLVIGSGPRCQKVAAAKPGRRVTVDASSGCLGPMRRTEPAARLCQ